MLRRPVEQPQGLGPRRGIELARPRPDLDPCFDRPEPQIPPHGVARDLELARDAFGAPSSPVQLADLANHLGVDHRHLRSRWCHARRLCRHVSSSLGPREEGSDLDSDGGHYCDRPTGVTLYSSTSRGVSQRSFDKVVAPYPHTERQRNQHNEFAKFRPHPFEERGDHREGYNTDARHKKADEQPKSSPQRVREQQAPHPKGRAKHVRDDHHSLPANFGVDEKTALGSKANRVTTRATALMAASQGNSNALSQTPPCSKSTGMSARPRELRCRGRACRSMPASSSWCSPRDWCRSVGRIMA